MPPAGKSLIKVGVITSAHGIKGEVKIRSSTGNPADILTHSALTNATGARAFSLKKQGIQKDLLIASIAGVTDRNAAELLKGTELFAPTPANPKRTADSWTYGELSGLSAILKNGKPYGKVTGVFNFGAGEIIELDLMDGKTEMLPFTHDFTGDVDLDKGTIIVIPPEYTEADE